LRPVIEQGYVYLAQPPLYRYKKGKKEIYLKDDKALNEYLIEHGIDTLEVEGMGKNDLTDMFKIVSAYRGVLAELEKRFHVLEVIQYLVENPDVRKLKGEQLYTKLETYIHSLGYNILNKKVSEEEVHLYVQNLDGLEEIRINEAFLTNPLFSEALHVFDKLLERELDMDASTLLKMLDDVEKSAKKGAYIQRYKGLGEMNPEQLWDTTMDPENRRLLRVIIDDALEASDTFTLFMGDEVEPRRNYIQEHAKDVKHLDV
jgi:DNA gyrase subunit B